MAVIGVPIGVDVPDIDAAIVSFDSVRIYKSASGEFGPWSLLSDPPDLPIPLVIDTTHYDYTDLVGLATDWYYTVPYNTVTMIEGEPSEPFSASTAPVSTALRLVRLTAERLGCKVYPETEHDRPGPSGTTTSAGTASQIISSQYADAGLAVGSPTASRVYRGHYISARSGAQGGEERRILTLDTTGGVFAVGVAFSGVVADGIDFDIFALRPTSWWLARLNEARLEVWYPYEYIFTGPAPSTTGARTVFPLPDFIEDRVMIEEIEQRSGENTDEWSFAETPEFQVRDLSGGGVYLYAPNGIPENAVYVITGKRHPRRLGSLDDEVAITEQAERRFIANAALRAALNLKDHPDDLGDRRELWKDILEGLTAECDGYAAEENIFDVVFVPGNEPFSPVGGGP